MIPIKPAALGGDSYVTKFVDQHTKWKEIFLIKTKPQALDALERYNEVLFDSEQHAFDSPQGGQRYGVYEF